MTPLRRSLALTFAALTASLVLIGSASAFVPSGPYCGMNVTADLKLNKDLDCSAFSGDALVVGASGITINLNGKTIWGDFDSSDTGVLNDGYTNVMVKNGTVRDYGTGVVHFGGADGSSAVHITALDDFYGVVDAQSDGVTFSNIIVDDAGIGVFVLDSSNSLVTKSSVHSAEFAFWLLEDGGNPTSNVFSKNTADNTGAGFFSVGAVNSTTWSGNKAKNSEFGFYDVGGNGALFAGNKASGTFIGYLIDHGGSGPVAMQKNIATGNELGFILDTAFLDNCSCPTDPGSTMTQNSATGNFGWGFLDVDDRNGTWTGNTSSGNGSEGFIFDAPSNSVITGNTAKGNGDTGFLLASNDPGTGDSAQSFMNNRATDNGDYGFLAEFVQSGSGNVAKNNTPFDCWNVSCQLGSTGPLSAPTHAKVTRPVLKQLKRPALPTYRHYHH
jgi:hypothetical protein